MRLIGGELESKNIKDNVYFTDSGRSSLRLFIRSGYQSKKFLIPNYFCEVIENILIEEKIAYEFYNINVNLTIDTKSLENQDFDVLYIINYFGQIQAINSLKLDDKTIIEDNVFFKDFKNNGNYVKWYGFNSFRKISSLSDGSLVKTNLKIEETLIIDEEASFSKEKRIAQDIKYDFVYKGKGSEKQYLEKFIRAENLLNNQKLIYKISNQSLYRLSTNKIDCDQTIMNQRFVIMNRLFSESILNNKSEFYSFVLLKVMNRDIIKSELIKKNIFLPIHWPKSSQDNNLYDQVISIPLFSNYTDEEFSFLIEELRKSFYDIKDIGV